MSRFLVDLAWHRDGLRQLFETEPSPRYHLLYLQTHQHEQATAGPLLVEPASLVALQRYRPWVEEGLAIELVSAQPFDRVADHLKTLTVIECEQAPPSLFRYADPRVLAGLEASLNAPERARLLGPNERMRGVVAGQAWQLQQDTEAAARYASSEAPFRLTRQHLQGIEAWRRQLMLQPLAAQYAISLERLIDWYQEHHATGVDNEQACLEYCRRKAHEARISDTRAHPEEEISS
ncbi:DUF4123 domain-containing protein [Modicisalibacter ilicicola]|nr:DUF4123 domain-containing protein [Halomonas ilicicola]